MASVATLNLREPPRGEKAHVPLRVSVPPTPATNLLRRNTAATMDSSRYYARPTSPGGRRLAAPERSSTGTFGNYDAYYTAQSARDQYGAPRSSAERVSASGGGVIPISTTHYVSGSGAHSTASRSSAGYDSFSGRPRRSTLTDADPIGRPASVVTSLPSRSARPAVVQSPVGRPSSPLTRTYDRDPYSGASRDAHAGVSASSHRHGHKKIYSVSEGKDAKLIAERDLDSRNRDYERRGRRESLDRGTTRRPSIDHGPARRESLDRHARRESVDRSGYKTTESRGRQKEYHLTGTANKPRVDDGYGYSYTDPAGMYRDTEPSWRPRRNSMDRSVDRSVDRSNSVRERPQSLVVPDLYQPPPRSYTTRETTRELGPPPSTRGFDRLNEGLLRAPAHETIRSPSRDRAPANDYAAQYRNGSLQADPYSLQGVQVPPRPASARPPPAIHQERDPRLDDRYASRDEYAEKRREPQRSRTYEDQDVATRGFGIRTDDYPPAPHQPHKVSPDVRPIYGSGPIVPDQPNPKNYTPEALIQEPVRRDRDRVRERNVERDHDYELPPRRERERDLSRDPRDTRDTRDYRETRDMDRERERPRERERDLSRDPRDTRDARETRDYGRDSGRDNGRSNGRDNGHEKAKDVLSKAAPVAAAAAGAYAVKEAMDRRGRDKQDRDKHSEEELKDPERRRRRDPQASDESIRERKYPREISRDRDDPRREERRADDREKPAAEPLNADDAYQQLLQKELQRTQQAEPRDSDSEREKDRRRKERERERERAERERAEHELADSGPKLLQQRDEFNDQQLFPQHNRIDDRVPEPVPVGIPAKAGAQQEPVNTWAHEEPDRYRDRDLGTGTRPAAQQEPDRYRDRDLGMGTKSTAQQEPDRYRERDRDLGMGTKHVGQQEPDRYRERDRQNSVLDAPLTQEPTALPGQYPEDEPSAEEIERERKRKVQIVEPPKDVPPPPKSILKQPTSKFPEDPNPIREGVAPLKDAKNKDKYIPPGARWTKIDRRLVNPQALEEKGERYEERLDCVIVLRVLSKEEIQKFADRTKDIRDERYERERAERHRYRSRDPEHRDRGSDTGGDSDYEESYDRRDRDRGRDRDREWERRREREMESADMR